MPVINLPPALFAMFQKLESRLQKLEYSKRFTAPVVGSDPTVPLNGDIWYNSNKASLKFVDSNGVVTPVGYVGLPQNSSTSGSYPITADDTGKHIYASATRTVTIPANSSVAFPIGTTLTFIAGAGATMTIAITTDTMYLAGAGTTGSRTLAAYGMATAVKITLTSWIISGNGLS